MIWCQEFTILLQKKPHKKQKKNKPGETDIKINTATVANAW